MQEGIEAGSEFVIARCEATELLEAAKEALDEISRFVAMPVGFALGRAVAVPEASIVSIRASLSYPLLAMTAPVGIAAT